MAEGEAPRKDAGLCFTVRKSPSVEELQRFRG